MIRRPTAPLLLLLLLGGCKEDLCAGVSCTAPKSCQADTGQCGSACDTVKCPAGLSCDGSTGRCKEPAQPPRPALGRLIDRVGRPGVNTLLNNPFDLYKPAGAVEPESGEDTRTSHNMDGDVAGWQARWAPYVSYHLAIYDALDGTCGNSLRADLTTPRYSALGAALAEDALHLDVSVGTCKDVYLAVEQKALGTALNDCGGRTLQMDVIDATYSLLTAGTSTGASDGVAFTANVSSSFPFLGIPPN